MRTTMIKSLTLSMATAAMLMACQKEETIDEVQKVAFVPVQHLNDCSVHILNDEHTDKFLSINSTEELNQIIFMNGDNESFCADLKEQLDLDFSQWTLLIGKKRIPHVKGQFLEQDVYSRGKNIVYKVILREGGYTAIGHFKFGVIIPKVPNGTKIQFDVSVINFP